MFIQEPRKKRSELSRERDGYGYMRGGSNNVCFLLSVVGMFDNTLKTTTIYGIWCGRT